MSDTLDQWAQWLLHRRHGGDEDRLKEVIDFLYPVRDKVLENAALVGDETLLDVGCGDGLIAFGALEHLDQGRVIFSDISQDLLDAAQSLATDIGVHEQCQFIQADATTLAPIADASVNVVTLRSVLIYVKEKQKAFHSFYRVLKSDGVLSLFEPINRYSYPQPAHVMWGYDVAPVQEIASKVKAVYRKIYSEDNPMLDFDERDLITMAEQAGFDEVHLELRIEVIPLHQLAKNDWEMMLYTAPNPLAPTLFEAMEQALTPDEINALTEYLRPKVEAQAGMLRQAIAYLWAVKY
jgi:ubiquinone/menaquinone biosynthesis C-methylase UbiE